MAVSTSASAGTVDRIRHIHGSSVANELIEFNFTDRRLGLDVQGWTSNANYYVKRTTLLLFINHRAVESTAIKKAIEQVYSPFLPKGGHPFTYLSLAIDPQRVDVNVHPTKREVHFLHEDEVIERLYDEIRLQLGNVDTSRTFMVQTLLPGARGAAMTTSASGEPGTDAGVVPRRKRYENNLVRTDAKMRKITSMLPSKQSTMATTTTTDDPGSTDGPSLLGEGGGEYEHVDRDHIVCRLITIKELRAEVRQNVHHDLTEMIAGHTFVGVVDKQRRIVAIQGGIKLFLVDYGMMWFVQLDSLGIIYIFH